jgi:NADPH:quinone reductase-like Zn-dependent oxidoreductase
MKAIIFEEYGTPDVLKVVEIDEPIPEDDQVLIKIYSTSVTT